MLFSCSHNAFRSNSLNTSRGITVIPIPPRSSLPRAA
jgi:hypothetical protein